MPQPRWYQIQADATGQRASVQIFGDIVSAKLFDDEVGAKQFIDEVNALDVAVLDLTINSPGGAVFPGLGIYETLRRHAARVRVQVDGLAASIASVIAMAGDEVAMSDTALLMIHDPFTLAGGNAADLRKSAEMLDQTKEVLLTAYESRSTLSRDEIAEAMQAETWYTADEAMAAGFVDTVTAGQKVAAAVNPGRFFNTPRSLVPNQAEPSRTRYGNGANTMSKQHQQADSASHDDALAAERARTKRIRDVFGVAFQSEYFAHQQADLNAAMNRLLDDPKADENEARKLLLEEMGKGHEPLSAGMESPRNDAVTMGGNGHHEDFRRAACDALLARNGIHVRDAHPAAKDLQGMSISDIAASFLSQSGRTGFDRSKASLIQASLTTSDMPALLENVAYKAAMMGFQEQEAATHRVWTRPGTLADFKPASRVALSEAPGLLKVPEAAEYHHGDLSDAKESIQLDTYGRIVSISRQALINDDLGELTRMPQALGQAAARREADLVYTLVTDNPTMRDGNTLFDTANHGNLTSSGGALTVANLGEARSAMRRQRGLAGESYLNVTPRYLIIPAALETDAEQLLVMIQPNTTQNAVPEWVRQLVVVPEPRLDDDSTTSWYLAGNPNAHDTIEVATLDGSQPRIEQNREFTRDVLAWKVSLDIGAAVIDWRALYKNPG